MGFLATHGGGYPLTFVTNFKPDLVVVNESSRTVVILELTCPWDANIDRSHEYKEERYSALVTDLSRFFRVRYYPVEVSVRG